MQNPFLAFSYQFKDPQWLKKMLIGSLMFVACFFIIPLPIMVGYMLQNIRNILDKKPNPMPEWKDFGKLFMSGLKFMFAMLGYMAPILLISIIMIFFAIFMALAGDSDVGSVLAVGSIFFMIISQAIISIYGLLMMFVYPILYVKGARQEPWQNFYKFKEIFRFIRLNFVNLLIVIGLAYIAGFSIFFGIMLFFIGIFPALFYSNSVMAYLYGQLGLEEKK